MCAAARSIITESVAQLTHIRTQMCTVSTSGILCLPLEMPILEETQVWRLTPHPFLISTVYLAIGSHGVLHETPAPARSHVTHANGQQYNQMTTHLVINCHADPVYALSRAMILDELPHPPTPDEEIGCDAVMEHVSLSTSHRKSIQTTNILTPSL